MSTTVIAHRGASGYELENSLAAFRAALSRGADAVELDVHATADGALVVHHDDILSARAHIPSLALRAVRRHRLRNGEPVPTLAEALAVLGTLRVFVEVKSLAPAHDAALLDALDQGPHPAGYAVHSFDHRIIRRLAERRPALALGILSTSYPVRPLAALHDAHAGTLWQERAVIDGSLVRAVHEGGAAVIVWTVNREEDMRRVAALGVDGICTNYPDVLRRLLDARVA